MASRKESVGSVSFVPVSTPPATPPENTTAFGPCLHWMRLGIYLTLNKVVHLKL